MENEQNREGLAALVVTYRGVQGYGTGIHEGKKGRVAVLSCEGARAGTYADGATAGKLAELVAMLAGAGIQNPGDVYIYLGANEAAAAAEAAARAFAAQGKTPTLVACDCGAEYKRQLADDIGARLVRSECGGYRTLQRIVRDALGE
jgi:hypothetical protein